MSSPRRPPEKPKAESASTGKKTFKRKMSRSQLIPGTNNPVERVRPKAARVNGDTTPTVPPAAADHPHLSSLEPVTEEERNEILNRFDLNLGWKRKIPMSASADDVDGLKPSLSSNSDENKESADLNVEKKRRQSHAGISHSPIHKWAVPAVPAKSLTEEEPELVAINETTTAEVRVEQNATPPRKRNTPSPVKAGSPTRSGSGEKAKTPTLSASTNVLLDTRDKKEKIPVVRDTTDEDMQRIFRKVRHNTIATIVEHEADFRQIIYMDVPNSKGKSKLETLKAQARVVGKIPKDRTDMREVIHTTYAMGRAIRLDLRIFCGKDGRLYTTSNENIRNGVDTPLTLMEPGHYSFVVLSREANVNPEEEMPEFRAASIKGGESNHSALSGNGEKQSSRAKFIAGGEFIVNADHKLQMVCDKTGTLFKEINERLAADEYLSAGNEYAIEQMFPEECKSDDFFYYHWARAQVSADKIKEQLAAERSNIIFQPLKLLGLDDGSSDFAKIYLTKFEELIKSSSTYSEEKTSAQLKLLIDAIRQSYAVDSKDVDAFVVAFINSIKSILLIDNNPFFEKVFTRICDIHYHRKFLEYYQEKFISPVKQMTKTAIEIGNVVARVFPGWDKTIDAKLELKELISKMPFLPRIYANDNEYFLHPAKILIGKAESNSAALADCEQKLLLIANNCLSQMKDDYIEDWSRIISRELNNFYVTQYPMYKLNHLEYTKFKEAFRCSILLACHYSSGRTLQFCHEAHKIMKASEAADQKFHPTLFAVANVGEVAETNQDNNTKKPQ